MSFDLSAMMNNNFLAQIMQSSIGGGSSFIGGSFGNSIFGGNSFIGGSTSLTGGTSLFGYNNYDNTNNNAIYNRNGYNVAYNSAAQAKSRQNTAVILSVLSFMMPAAAKFLDALITGLANQKLGEIQQKNPTQKSAVVSGGRKENVKQEKAKLEDAILKDQNILAKLDQKGGKDALANLEKIATGEQYNNVTIKGKDNNQLTMLNNLAGKFAPISPDLSSINSQLKNNLSAEFTSEFPDDLSETTNFSELSAHQNDMQNYSTDLETFITDIGNLCIDMEDIDFDSDAGYKELNDKYNEIANSDDENKNAKLAEINQKIEQYKNDKLNELQDALDEIRDKAIEEAETQKQDISEYEDMLSQLEMDLDSLTPEQKDSLESQLADNTLTFDELLEKSCSEADKANEKLSELANQKGDVSAAYTEAEQRIAENTDKLKLLDFANEKFKDLDNGSDISRKQARQLRQAAQDLYANGGTFAQLEEYATTLGIDLSQTGQTDTNGNGVFDNWTNKANKKAATNTNQTSAATPQGSTTSTGNTQPRMGVFDLGFNPLEYQQQKSAQEILFPAAETATPKSGTTPTPYTDTTVATGQPQIIFDNDSNELGTSISMTADGKYFFGGLDHADDDVMTYLNRIDNETFFSPDDGAFIDSKGMRIVDVSADMLSKAGFEPIPGQENTYKDASGQQYILNNGLLIKR